MCTIAIYGTSNGDFFVLAGIIIFLIGTIIAVDSGICSDFGVGYGLVGVIIGGILIIAGAIVVYNDEEKNINNAIWTKYPGAIVKQSKNHGDGFFVFSGKAYSYKIKDKKLYIITPDGSMKLIDGTIDVDITPLIVKNASDDTDDSKNSAQYDNSSASDIKSLIYSAYSSVEISYSDGDTTGYFKTNGEYYSFTLDSSNIVIKDSSGKISNIITRK